MPNMSGEGVERPSTSPVEAPVPTNTPEQTSPQQAPAGELLRSNEKPTEQLGELKAIRGDISAAMTSQAAGIQAVTNAQVTQDNSSNVVNSSTPVVANDDDVIEKEWVDAAKNIVQQTFGDPARRSAEVGAIKKDYLKKRFGKDLGAKA